ncbi:Ubiquitin-protein ligase E3C [Nymphon striatum]|nr:Ubiquitin-protein ligase E3C [Nymphon striatum]
MYSFDGQFKKRPIQSLGGAKKNEQRQSLLSRTANERQKREKSELRLKFDELMHNVDKNMCVADENVIKKLSQAIIIFFEHTPEDNQRLVHLNMILLKSHTLVARALLSSTEVWKYRIKQLLLLNLQAVAMETEMAIPVATPLRMLEIYTNKRTYEKVASVNQVDDTLTNIFSFLIKNNYYSTLKKLIMLKVPSSLIKSVNPPTEFASSLLELILSPINRTPSKNFELRCKILKSLVETFLVKPFTPQISCFLLPVLTAKDEKIPMQIILDAIYDEEDDVITVASSTYLLYSILSFFKAQHDVDKLRSCLKYVLIMGHLCRVLSSLKSRKGNSFSDDEEMESDSLSDEQELEKECVDMLNDPVHVSVVLSIVDTFDSNSRCINAICHICHSLLDHSKLAIFSYRLLYILAFRRTFLHCLWDSITSYHMISIFDSKTPLLQVLARGLILSNVERESIFPKLAVFCSLFSYLLYTVDDAELSNIGKENSVLPFTMQELVGMSHMLRDVCLGIIEIAYPDSRCFVKEEYKQAVGNPSMNELYYNDPKIANSWSNLLRIVITLVRQIHLRDTRKSFCPEDHWLTNRVKISKNKLMTLDYTNSHYQNYLPFTGVRSLTREELESTGPPISTEEVRTMMILKELPFVISFTDRVLIFRHFVEKDKAEMQSQSGFMTGPMVRVRIRRNYIYEDAFDKLSYQNEDNLKRKMVVQLLNAAGVEEAGIDGGGIFKEFLNSLLKTGFDPNRGFFQTTSNLRLFPSPHAHLISESFKDHFYFLGRMLGKAIYENMLVELPCAGFFLSKLLVGQSSYVDIHHLNSLDPVLYKNLLSLKTYEGDISSLGLDFTVLNDEFGETETVELKKDGANIPVTSSNVIEYIHLVSDYKLNKQIHKQCAAFGQGLNNVINLEWLQIFDYQELQVLISGASVPIDIEDLKKNTVYSRDYSLTHPVIEKFWNVVETFDQESLRKLLKFVTSCSHPPLLGFKELYPSFCIHNAGNDPDRLPTASTCMNLLKLPEFQDKETLRSKLLYAIQSESGFELS